MTHSRRRDQDVGPAPEPTGAVLLEAHESRASATGHLVSGTAIAGLLGWIALTMPELPGALTASAFAAAAFWALIAARGVWGLIDRGPRLTVTTDGIEDRTHWLSPGFVPWRDVTDVRPAAWGAGLDVADPRAMLRRIGPGRRWLVWLNAQLSPRDLTVGTGGLEVSRAEAFAAIESAFETWQLGQIRETKRLEAGRGG